MQRASTTPEAPDRRERLASAGAWIGVVCALVAIAVAATAVDGEALRTVLLLASFAVLVLARQLTEELDRTRLRRRLSGTTEVLRNQAGRDPLTGLLNRSGLADALRRDPAALEQRGLLLISLDGLDVVRRTLGHDQGDALVLGATERVVTAAGPSATVARLDGGELVVVAGDGGTDLARELLDVIAGPQTLAGLEVVTTASIGIAPPSTHPDGIDVGDVLRDASVALDAARRAGGAGVATYEPGLDGRALTDLRLTAELRRAVPDRELEVYYQPIVALPGRQVVGAEALIRWNHPREGVLTPDRWLDVADAAGLLPEIGRATLDEVCRRFATLNTPDRRHPLRIAVNLAPSELHHPDLVRTVTDILSASHLAPTQLAVEISDRAVLDDQAAAAILGLRELGVRVALDDFGTGLAAIGRLGRLPIDELKLDDSVVRGVGTDGVERSVLESIVGLCHRLDVDVIAEGVTNEADADALAQLGCQYAQGWMFGRPLPFSRFVALLDRLDAETARTGPLNGRGTSSDAPSSGTTTESVDAAAATGASGEAGGAIDGLP